MAARFAKLTEAQIVALFEKTTPENTKKQLNMEYIIKHPRLVDCQLMYDSSSRNNC